MQCLSGFEPYSRWLPPIFFSFDNSGYYLVNIHVKHVSECSTDMKGLGTQRSSSTACENSGHFTTPPLVTLRNDVWESRHYLARSRFSDSAEDAKEWGRRESERYSFYFHNPRRPDFLEAWNRLVTIKIWVLVLQIGRVGSDICFNQSEALSRSGTSRWNFYVRFSKHISRENQSGGVVQNVSCFLKQRGVSRVTILSVTPFHNLGQ